MGEATTLAGAEQAVPGTALSQVHSHSHARTHTHTHTQSFQCLPHACSIALSCTLSLPLLQLFSRDAETAESWMAAREAFFSKENVGASLDRVETLIRKSEDFDKSVKAQVGSLFPYLFP